jgi:uncharacterized protein YecE (DUF72 family)
VAKLRFGCSGWDYQEWVGPFYRSTTESKLAAYSRVFDTAEINSTFYRVPEKGMVLGWARYTHDEFRFAAKVPQTVTHDRLCDVARGADKELLAYCEIMRPLLDAGKLGPLLLQLPPRLRFNESKLREFFAILPPEFTWALEPRNKSWMVEEAFDLLAAHNLAYTIVDEPLLPPTLRVTAKTAYVRWHGHGKDPWYDYRYSDEELKAWAPKVQEVAARVHEVYGFWNNHYHGYAPENCLQVLEMLGVELTPAQVGAARRIAEFRKGLVRTATGTVRTVTLEDFGGAPPPVGGRVEAMLGKFLDPGRLDRARRSESKAVEIIEDEDASLVARVKDYRVVFDIAAKRIVHDCEDWATQLRARRFCKHLGGVVLALPSERATRLLEELAAHKDDWTFALPET